MHFRSILVLCFILLVAIVECSPINLLKKLLKTRLGKMEKGLEEGKTNQIELIENNPVKAISTVKEFSHIVRTHKTVVIDFHSNKNSAPCRDIFPHFLALAKENPTIKFISIDVDNSEQELSKQVDSVPRFILWKTNGKGRKVASGIKGADLEGLKKLVGTAANN